MKKKGFTLIELLAVIVILAVIALIATPMIMDVIEKSRKGAAESSANGYIDALIQYKVVSALDGTPDIGDGTYTIDELNSYNIEVKGKKPSAGTVVIESGKVKDYELQFDQYVVTYDAEQQKGVAEKKEYNNIVYKTYAVGSEVTLPDGSEWYVINDDGSNSETVSLFSKYNINVTTNKQDSALTGDADDPQSVQFDDGSRNNENNTYCQLYHGTYYGCSAYEAIEGDVHDFTQSAIEYSDGVRIEIEGTVTEDSNIKKYVDSYVASLNLGNFLVSSKLLDYKSLMKLGCTQSGLGGYGSSVTCSDTTYTWIYSTNYWMMSEYNDIGGSYYMVSLNQLASPHYPVNIKSGVRPMIVVKKSAIQS